MGTKKRWQEVDAHLIGLAVLQALANVDRGLYGEVDLDLGDRWVKIDTLDRPAFVVVSEIEAPVEFLENGEGIDEDGSEAAVYLPRGV